MLAMVAVQPLVGKLSDIYGRKPILLLAYTLFTIGNLGAGLGRSLGEVIAWRAVQGAGGAGMGSLVAIIIVDIVPLHEVASIRGYVNIMQTSGRTCGGVIGGWLTRSLGWRWEDQFSCLQPSLVGPSRADILSQGLHGTGPTYLCRDCHRRDSSQPASS